MRFFFVIKHVSLERENESGHRPTIYLFREVLQRLRDAFDS